MFAVSFFFLSRGRMFRWGVGRAVVAREVISLCRFVDLSLCF